MFKNICNKFKNILLPFSFNLEDSSKKRVKFNIDIIENNENISEDFSNSRDLESEDKVFSRARILRKTPINSAVNQCGIICPSNQQLLPEITELKAYFTRKKEKDLIEDLNNKYNLRKEPQKINFFDKDFTILYTSNNNKTKNKNNNKNKKIYRNNTKKVNKITKKSSKVSFKKINKIKKTNKIKKIKKKKNKKNSNINKSKNEKSNIKHKRKQISLIDRKKVLFDQKYICNFCEKMLDPNHEFDHIIPLFCGGTNKYSNYQALCKECHQYKSDFLDERIIKPMTNNKNNKCDPKKVIIVLKKIYQNHYS
jgi:5-methylcytosine-specific restriction endonuclease McrA